MTGDPILIDLNLLAEDDWTPTLATAGEGLSALSEPLGTIEGEAAAASAALDALAESAGSAGEAVGTIAGGADEAASSIEAQAASADLAAEADATWAQTLADVAAAQEAATAATEAATVAYQAQIETMAAVSTGAAQAAAAQRDANAAITEGGAATASSSAGMGVAALAVAGVGVAAVATGTQFEASMNKLAAAAGVPTDQIGQLRDQVLSLAQETGASPNQLAQALYYVKSAGFDASDAMTVLGVATKTAIGFQTDATPVADALTSALRAYGASAQDASHYADVLAATTVNGKMQFSDLADSIGRVLPVAAEAGIPIEQVGASIAEMTQKGLNADEATTALRGTIQALEAPTKQTNNELANLGLTADDVKKEIADKGLLSTLDDLVQREGGNMESLRQLIPNVRALTGALADTGTAGGDYQQVLAGIQNSNGQAMQSFALFETTTKATFDHIKADIEVGLIDAFNAAEPQVAGALARVQAQASAFLANLQTVSSTAQLYWQALAGSGAGQAVQGLLNTPAGQAVSNIAGDVAGVVGQGGINGVLGTLNPLFGASQAIDGFNTAVAGIEGKVGPAYAAVHIFADAVSEVPIVGGTASAALNDLANKFDNSGQKAQENAQKVADFANQVSQHLQTIAKAGGGTQGENAYLFGQLNDLTNQQVDLTTQAAGAKQGSQQWKDYENQLSAVDRQVNIVQGDINKLRDAEITAVPGAAQQAMAEIFAAISRSAKDAQQSAENADNSANTLYGDAAKAITPSAVNSVTSALNDLYTAANNASTALQTALSEASDKQGGQNAIAETYNAQYDAIQNVIKARQSYDQQAGIDQSTDQTLIGLQKQALQLYNDYVLPANNAAQAMQKQTQAANDLSNAYDSGQLSAQQVLQMLGPLTSADQGVVTAIRAHIQANEDLNNTYPQVAAHTDDVTQALGRAEHGAAMFGSAAQTSGQQVAGTASDYQTGSNAATDYQSNVSAQAATAQSNVATATGGIKTDLQGATDVTPDMGGYAESLATQASAAGSTARAQIEAQLQNIAATATVTILTNGVVQSSSSDGGYFTPGAGGTTTIAPSVPGAGGGGSLSAGDLALLSNDNLDTLIGAGVGMGPNDQLVMGVDAGGKPKPIVIPKAPSTPSAPSHSGGGSHSGGSSHSSNAATSSAAQAAVESAKQLAHDTVQALDDGLNAGLASLDAIIHPDGKNALVARLEADLTDPNNTAGLADATNILISASIGNGAAGKASGDQLVQAWWEAVSKGVTDPTQLANLQQQRDAMLQAMADATPALTQIAASDATIQAADTAWTAALDPNSVAGLRDKLVNLLDQSADPNTLLDVVFGTQNGQLSPQQAAKLPAVVDAARKAIEDSTTLTPDQQATALANLATFVTSVSPTVTSTAALATATTQASQAANAGQSDVSAALNTKSTANAAAIGQQVGAAVLQGDDQTAIRLLMSDPLELESVVKAAEDFIKQSGATAEQQIAAMQGLTADIGSASAQAAPNLAQIDTSGKSDFDLSFQYSKSTGKNAPDYTNLERQAANDLEQYALSGDRSLYQKAVQLIASTGTDAEKVGNAVADLIKNDVAAGVAGANKAQDVLGQAGSDVGSAIYAQDQSKKNQTGAGANAQAIADYNAAQGTLATDQTTMGNLQASRNLILAELATAAPGSQDQQLLQNALATTNSEIAAQTQIVDADLQKVAGLQQKANDAVDANLAAQQKEFSHMPGMTPAQQPPGVGVVPSPQAFAEAWFPAMDVYVRGGAVGDTNFLAARQWITAADKLNAALDKQNKPPVIHLHATSFMNGRIVGYIAGEAQGSDIELAQRGMPSSAAPTNVPTYSGSASGLYQVV